MNLREALQRLGLSEEGAMEIMESEDMLKLVLPEALHQDDLLNSTEVISSQQFIVDLRENDLQTELKTG